MDPGANVILDRVTISQNTSRLNIGAVNIRNQPIIKNSIIWSNSGGSIEIMTAGSPVISYSDIHGGWSGTGNININPNFINITDNNYYIQD